MVVTKPNYKKWWLDFHGICISSSQLQVPGASGSNSLRNGWLLLGFGDSRKKTPAKIHKKTTSKTLRWISIMYIYICIHIYIYLIPVHIIYIYIHIQFHNIYDMISNSYIHPITSAYSRFSMNVCFCIPKKTASFGFLEFQEGVAKKVLKDDGWIIGFLVGPTVYVGPSIQGNYNTPLEHTLGNPPSQLWKESIYSLLVKVPGCVPKVCWNNLRIYFSDCFILLMAQKSGKLTSWGW